MPSQVRIISPKNSAEWDHLVRGLINDGKLGQEQIYGGCASEERADHVRRKIRTAARKQDVASKVFWKPCDKPGKCSFGADCTHHVYITLYPLADGQAYKVKQAQAQRR